MPDDLAAFMKKQLARCKSASEYRVVHFAQRMQDLRADILDDDRWDVVTHDVDVQHLTGVKVDNDAQS